MKINKDTEIELKRLRKKQYELTKKIFQALRESTISAKEIFRKTRLEKNNNGYRFK